MTVHCLSQPRAALIVKSNDQNLNSTASMAVMTYK